MIFEPIHRGKGSVQPLQSWHISLIAPGKTTIREVQLGKLQCVQSLSEPPH